MHGGLAHRKRAQGVMLTTIRRLRRLVAAYKLVDVRVDKQNVKTSGAAARSVKTSFVLKISRPPLLP